MLRVVLISSLLLLSAGALGQSATQLALKHYQNKELREAQEKIDSAITLKKEKKEAYTWQVRGFIYKDLFKATEEPERSKNRKKAIGSFKKAIEKGAEERVKKACQKGLKYMAQTYYNDAMKRLDTSRIEKPVQLYERYISLMKESGKAEKDLKKDIIGFKNSLGVVYMSLYEKQRGHDKESFEKAIDAFGEVLRLDSSNYLANYNSGILYYNWGVQIAQKVDPTQMDVDLKKVKKMQKRSTQKFKKALPYMKKAHEQRPKRLETLEGLSGIYYSLNEDEKSKHYKELKKKIIKERKH